MPIPPQESWTIAKPAVLSEGGIVVAQNARAAAAGAEILAAGGNAVDAAVATALALGVREPWMSGIGGVGLLVYGEAATGRVEIVDFAAQAPLALDPARYPAAAGVSDELFGWPRVEGDRNLRGYEFDLRAGLGRGVRPRARAFRAAELARGDGAGAGADRGGIAGRLAHRAVDRAVGRRSRRLRCLARRLPAVGPAAGAAARGAAAAPGACGAGAQLSPAERGGTARFL